MKNFFLFYLATATTPAPVATTPAPVETTPAPVETTPAPVVCGKGFDIDERVVGGVNATAGSWPWQAALKINGDLTCGGTLVAKDWVLTAGHCLILSGTRVTEQQLEVVLGDHDR